MLGLNLNHVHKGSPWCSNKLKHFIYNSQISCCHGTCTKSIRRNVLHYVKREVTLYVKFCIFLFAMSLEQNEGQGGPWLTIALNTTQIISWKSKPHVWYNVQGRHISERWLSTYVFIHIMFVLYILAIIRLELYKKEQQKEHHKAHKNTICKVSGGPFWGCNLPSLIPLSLIVSGCYHTASGAYVAPLTSSFKCSITPKFAKVTSRYSHMRGLGICRSFLDRSKCSHCTVE